MDEVNVGKWISVEDRLPGASDCCLDDDHEVLCYHANGRIFVGGLVQYMGKYRWETQETDGRVRYAGEVTHWMPLPEPPNE